MQTNINIIRSWKSDCWKGDLENAQGVYTDRELAQIHDHGYNGIWLHQPLRDYTPSRVFPEFGAGHARYLRILERLIARAGRHGIKVYLYLLEPRALLAGDPFWQRHADLKGQYWKQPVYDREYYALCSSHPLVREYLRDSLQAVTSRLAGLGGFFTILAGEDYSTCVGKLWKATHSRRAYPNIPDEFMLPNVLTCPRCRGRSIAEIFGELLNAIYAGIQAGNPACKLIAWDWGWDRLPRFSTRAVLGRMHKDIIFVSDFEIGGERTILGRKRLINEYSLSYVGPSPRFKAHYALAAKTGRCIGAKLQVGTTHELATVPNLPLLHNLCRKVAWLRAHDIRVVLATWNIGNMPTANTYAFGRTYTAPAGPTDRIFYRHAAKYLGVKGAGMDVLMRAWRLFGRAMDHYPYSTPLVCFGPMNYAPAFWLEPRKIAGKSLAIACDDLERGDDLSPSLGKYSLDEMIRGFEAAASTWARGLALCAPILKGCGRANAEAEYRSASCVWHVFRSVAHIYRLYQLCCQWDPDTSAAPYRELCRLERENCLSLLPLLKADKRLGFHPECQRYLFNAELVRKKLARLARPPA